MVFHSIIHFGPNGLPYCCWYESRSLPALFCLSRENTLCSFVTAELSNITSARLKLYFLCCVHERKRKKDGCWEMTALRCFCVCSLLLLNASAGEFIISSSDWGIKYQYMFMSWVTTFCLLLCIVLILMTLLFTSELVLIVVWCFICHKNSFYSFSSFNYKTSMF